MLSPEEYKEQLNSVLAASGDVAKQSELMANLLQDYTKSAEEKAATDAANANLLADNDSLKKVNYEKFLSLPVKTIGEEETITEVEGEQEPEKTVEEFITELLEE